jgi:hypothetical protein
MPTLSERRTEGDIVRHQFNYNYNIEQVVVHNRTGSTVSAPDVMGYPLRPDSGVGGEYMFAMQGGESYVNAILIDHRSFQVSTLANLAVFTSKALVRGPAIIDQSALPTADLAAANFNMATIVTALKGLVPPVLSRIEPATTVTQTN